MPLACYMTLKDAALVVPLSRLEGGRGIRRPRLLHMKTLKPLRNFIGRAPIGVAFASLVGEAVWEYRQTIKSKVKEAMDIVARPFRRQREPKPETAQ